MERGYGTHDYAITVREAGGKETTHTHTEERQPITVGQVLDLPLFGRVKVTELVEEAGIGRAGRAYAERVADKL